MPQDADNSITEITRRSIFDEMTVAKAPWSGRMDEVDFLMRICDVASMRSTDTRFSDATGDIWQHRTRNLDWEHDWVFTDGRFNLLRGPDEVFLAFLCEMLHPVVQPNEKWVTRLVKMFNKHLAADGWEIAPVGEISDRAIYAGRRLLTGAGPAISHAKQAAAALNATYISRQIGRMEKSIIDDPELAIGTAKEFIETICKTILSERGVAVDKGSDIPKLTRKVMREIGLVDDGLPHASKIKDVVQRLLSNLATIGQGVGELRNLAGSGHGKVASSEGLEPRHARLTVAAASALGVFLFETYQAQGE